MSILAVIMLATSIQFVTPTALVGPVTARAETNLVRQASAQQEVVRQKSVQAALASSSRAFGRSLERQLAATRIRTPISSRAALFRNAKARLDLEVARNAETLHRRAVIAALNDISQAVRASMKTRVSHVPGRMVVANRPTRVR